PGDPRVLHSFPTRRSSDLAAACIEAGAMARADDLARRRIPIALAQGAVVMGTPILDRVELAGAVVDADSLRADVGVDAPLTGRQDRKSTRLNSSHSQISYA